MKKIYLCMLSLIGFVSLHAQVGINTKTPKGVFHIDPKGDTNSSGTSGFVDDVYVDTKGNLGIGTLSPSTHVHIDKGSSNSLIRIEDGSEGTGDKFLLSDDVGNGTWIPRVKLNGKVYRMTSPSQTTLYFPVNTNTPILFNKVKPDIGSITDNPDNGYVKIDNDGSYIFTFRWWGSSDLPVVSEAYKKYHVTSAFLKIRKVVGGVVQPRDIDNILITVNIVGATLNRSAFAISMFAPDLKKGDLYAIILAPQEKTWILGLGLNAATGQFDNVIYFPSLMVYNI